MQWSALVRDNAHGEDANPDRRNVPYTRNPKQTKSCKEFIYLYIKQLDYELEISEVIVNEDEARVNYCFIEIESE